MSKQKIKDKVAIRIRKRLRKWAAQQQQRRGSKPALVLFFAALLVSCATSGYTAPLDSPPRLAAPPPCACPERNPARDIDLDIDFPPPALEPLPFVKHPVAELYADEAAAARANPEREAREAIADFKIGEFLRSWDQL